MQTSENANQEMRNVMGSMVSSYSMKIDNDDMYIRASMSMNDLPQNVTIEQREKIDTFSKLAFISKCKRSTNKCEFYEQTTGFRLPVPGIAQKQLDLGIAFDYNNYKNIQYLGDGVQNGYNCYVFAFRNEDTTGKLWIVKNTGSPTRIETDFPKMIIDHKNIKTGIPISHFAVPENLLNRYSTSTSSNTNNSQNTKKENMKRLFGGFVNMMLEE